VTGLRGSKDFVSKSIPDGTSFSVKDGKFATTLPIPSTFKLDQTAVVVVDTSLTGLDIPKDVPKDTAAIIGTDAVFLFNGENERRVRALKDFPNFEVTKEQMLGKLKTYGSWAAVGLLLILFLAYLGTILAGNLLFVGVTSIMMMFAAKLWKVRMTVGQFAAVGFHAVTLPTLVDLLTVSFGLRIPYVFTGIYLLIMVAVVMDERNKPVEVAEKQSDGVAELRSGGEAIVSVAEEKKPEEKAVVAVPEKSKKRAPRRAAKRKKPAAEKPPEENQGPPVVW
jgi:hypothetical protein